MRWISFVFGFLFIFLFNGLNAQNEDSLRINRKILATAIVTESSVYVGSMAYLQYIWYKDHDRVPFHYYNDNAGYLQIDKFGHAYGSFLESDICYQWLLKAGVNKKKALIYGATMGIILQTPIEIFDGIYEGWGFSWGDMAANAAGSGFIIGQELWFKRRIVDLKFSFQRSAYAPDSHGMLGDNYLESLFYDYNGHSYWLSLGIQEFIPIKFVPSWLDVSLGYSANGMYGEFENSKTWYGLPLPEVERHRQFFLSLDIDWTEIDTDRPLLKDLFKALNYIKLPFPALEYNRIDGLKFRTLYF